MTIALSSSLRGAVVALALVAGGCFRNVAQEPRKEDSARTGANTGTSPGAAGKPAPIASSLPIGTDTQPGPVDAGDDLGVPSDTSIRSHRELRSECSGKEPRSFVAVRLALDANAPMLDALGTEHPLRLQIPKMGIDEVIFQSCTTSGLGCRVRRDDKRVRFAYGTDIFEVHGDVMQRGRSLVVHERLEESCPNTPTPAICVRDRDVVYDLPCGAVVRLEVQVPSGTSTEVSH